jgi:CRP-like cAMP-binding protein
MTDNLLQVLTAIHPLSEAFKITLDKELTLLSFPKNYILLEPPKIAGHAYFLNEGFAICYTFFDGKKQIEGIWKAGQIIISARSFFEQVPAREFIELIVPSTILCISYPSVMKLFERFPEANFIYRVVMNQYYEQSRQCIRDLQHLSAIARYKKMVMEFPGIEQIIPQEQIASYLGITPQSLSRIKRHNDRT